MCIFLLQCALLLLIISYEHLLRIVLIGVAAIPVGKEHLRPCANFEVVCWSFGGGFDSENG